MIEVREFQLPASGLLSLPTGSVKRIVHTLGQQIVDGRFQPGETLPTEAELSEDLEVSRTVLREAVKVLSGKGLLRTARRYGTRIRPFEEWHLLDPDVVHWHGPNSPTAPRIYRESTTLRRIVEPEAAALAAAHASPDQVQVILAAAHSIKPNPFGVSSMLAADYAFHSTILESSGNVMLAQLSGLILALLQFSYPTGARGAPEVKVSWRDHAKVAEAIAARQPELAKASMRDMLSQNQIVADRFAEAKVPVG